MKKILALTAFLTAVQFTNAQCSDPAIAIGSTGCVTFTYRGQQVTYTTVRASDGQIWLQQNLGSSNVATSVTDAGSYGDLFQWGRWDDGHQLRTSTSAAASTLSANNPSGLGTGSANFYTGFWNPAAATDTWSGTTASASNGTDPCTALGTGWHLPSYAEWSAMRNAEGVFTTNASSVFSSSLKLPEAGQRDGSSGSVIYAGQYSFYWASTTAATGSTTTNSYADNFTIGAGFAGTYYSWPRSAGLACRCIKAAATTTPVVLASFTGIQTGAENILNWQTATEINNDGFVIERSEDGVVFNYLSYVNSKAVNGNSSALLNYQFTDQQPLATSYYRLKQMDKNGNFSYSNTVLLKGTAPKIAVSVYPNPVIDQLTITITTKETGKVSLIISDMSGKLIWSQNTALAAGNNLLQVNASPFAKGAYAIKIITANGNTIHTGVFIK